MMAQTRQNYDGPLEMGEDLMSFEIEDTITVRRPQSLPPEKLVPLTLIEQM
jgi:hypothetical protein